jgi:hypothetical protein
VQEVEQREILTREQEAVKLISNTPVQSLIDSLLPVVSSMNSAQFESAEQLVASAVKLHITPEKQNIVINNELSKLRKQVGMQNEQKAINMIERRSAKPVTDSNKTFYSKKIGKCSYLAQYEANLGVVQHNVAAWLQRFNSPKPLSELELSPAGHDSQFSLLQRDWAVGGKVDGFNGGQLIEIKNRTKAIPPTVPFYDRAQFEVYLQVLELQHGYLVERLQQNTGNSSANSAGNQAEISEYSKTTRLQRDDRVWRETLVPRLASFCDFLHTFMLQRARQIEFIRAVNDAEKAIQIAAIIPLPIKQQQRKK